jgi:hypothetical protein
MRKVALAGLLLAQVFGSSSCSLTAGAINVPGGNATGVVSLSQEIPNHG